MFRARQASLVYRLRIADRMPPSQPRRAEPSESSPVVLILSGDAVAAALLGFLVETLGYDVRFARPPESPSATLRRVRPRICLVDCADPESCGDEFVGHATMRGVSVVIFGTRATLDRVRDLARQHRIETLLMPVQLEALQSALSRVRGE
jgi:DNA-binding NtrC family response regulator